MKTKTITTSQPHTLGVGDLISIDVRDTRWWRRLWFFLTCRKLPPRTKKYKVTAVVDATSVHIQP